MLARQSIARVRVAAGPVLHSNARNMATLREIELRLKSVRNIEKITKVFEPRFTVLCWLMSMAHSP
jgi:F-type H+-transporting ATPase subunit gamma